MGRIANILDLPLDQKFTIVSLYLSVEFLSAELIENETRESLMKRNFEYVKAQLGNEISETTINSYMKKILDFHDSLDSLNL